LLLLSTSRSDRKRKKRDKELGKKEADVEEGERKKGKGGGGGGRNEFTTSFPITYEKKNSMKQGKRKKFSSLSYYSASVLRGTEGENKSRGREGGERTLIF